VSFEKNFRDKIIDLPVSKLTITHTENIVKRINKSPKKRLRYVLSPIFAAVGALTFAIIILLNGNLLFHSRTTATAQNVVTENQYDIDFSHVLLSSINNRYDVNIDIKSWTPNTNVVLIPAFTTKNNILEFGGYGLTSVGFGSFNPMNKTISSWLTKQGLFNSTNSIKFMWYTGTYPISGTLFVRTTTQSPRSYLRFILLDLVNNGNKNHPKYHILWSKVIVPKNNKH